MKTVEFNLADEPWIRVIRHDLTEETVSLSEVMLHAQEYEDLNGENQPQNFAVLRVLTALAYTIFSRTDADGNPDDLTAHEELTDAQETALLRWEDLWNAGGFPAGPVESYMQKQHDCFWLFHPTNPFGQVPEAKKGTEYGVSKLIGDISESGNKIRLFAGRSGSGKEKIRYGEAARWLLYINAFDDTSAKPKQKGLPSPGAGWVGKLGMIEGVGRNLFETIMLNLTFLQDGAEPWQDEADPNWEHDPKPDERTEIAVPCNPASLLTLQSRRILLDRKEGFVTGYRLLGGDFFSADEAFQEQMTVWRYVKQGKQTLFRPRRMEPSRQMWRDFGNFFIGGEENHIPGVVSWFSSLRDEQLIPSSMAARFRAVSMKYGDKDFYISDISSDILTMSSDLLRKSEAALRNRIDEQVKKCDQAAVAFHYLVYDIYVAGGGDTEKKTNEGKERFYQMIDEPFRQWLMQIDANEDPDRIARRFLEWEERARTMACRLAEQIEKEAGMNAYTGHYVYDRKKDTELRFSVPEADLKFRRKIYQIYPKAGE